jgi:TolA-binding protein
MIADFNDHPDLPGTLYWIADGYKWANRYEDADNIYRLAIQKIPPGSPFASNAKLGIARTEVTSLIVSEDYNQADAATEKMITDYLNNNRVADALYEIAYHYYSIGKYEKAIQYFQRLISDWPDYQYAWNAQCWIGECYGELKKSGTLPASEANPLIKQAYQTLIEKYPGCSLVGHACLKLARLSFSEKQPVEAAEYLELFLEKSPDDPRVPDVLYDLGRAYEQMGQLDLAVETYGKFIAADPNSSLVEGLQKRFEALRGQTK